MNKYFLIAFVCVFISANSLAQSTEIAEIIDVLKPDFGKEETPLSEKIALDFFKIHQISSAKLSPSGKFIALMQNEGTKSQLILINTDSYGRTLLLQDNTNNLLTIINYHWVGDASIIIETFIEGKGRKLVQSNLIFEGGELVDLENKFLLDNVFVVNPLLKQQNRFIIEKYIDGKKALYKIDLNKKIGGQLRSKYRLNKRGPKSPSWLTDSAGRLVAAYGVGEKSSLNTMWLKDKKRNKWKTAWEGAENIRFEPVLVEKDNKNIVVLSNEQDDLTCLYNYDPAERSYTSKIYCHDVYDIDSAITGLEDDSILGVSFVKEGYKEVFYFNKADKFLDVSLELSVDESIPYIIDYNLDKTVAIVQTSSSTYPGDYHLFDIKDMELKRFATKAPWLAKYNMNESKVVSSISVDGKSIESYLTLPSKSSESLPPLIVMPHGGPISIQDTRHFNSHVQFLAAMGYAVLQPNYRGSSGFGKSFLQEGMGQWGRLIEDDIESGVNEAINLGLVDGKKVCIYGISYGGYSALISAINRSDLFKCAASYAGVTDLPLLFNDIELVESNRLNKLMKKIIGDPNTQLDELMKFSPVYQIAKLNIPVFLAHGREDEVVDIEHYYRMKKMLDMHRKQREFLVFDDETHGFRYLRSIVAFYVKLDNFFKKSLEL